MNATVFTATILEHQRAAQLDRDNELIRRQAERPAAATGIRPTGFAVVTDWFRGLGQHRQSRQSRPVIVARAAH